jgi:hypothetical protein
MPQLDIVSYFPQFFWFCIFFTGFYVTLVQHYLPKLTRIFAVRQDAQQNQHSEVSSDEFQHVALTTQNVFSQSVQHTQKNCAHHFKETQKFLDVKTDVFNTHTNQAFKKYQTKKIQLNQTVKNTMHQLQGVLPMSTSNAQRLNPLKTSQFFDHYLVYKIVLNQSGQKTKQK